MSKLKCLLFVLCYKAEWSTRAERAAHVKSWKQRRAEHDAGEHMQVCACGCVRAHVHMHMMRLGCGKGLLSEMGAITEGLISC